jgi:hypothetical protein
MEIHIASHFSSSPIQCGLLFGGGVYIYFEYEKQFLVNKIDDALTHETSL